VNKTSPDRSDAIRPQVPANGASFEVQRFADEEKGPDRKIVVEKPLRSLGCASPAGATADVIGKTREVLNCPAEDTEPERLLRCHGKHYIEKYGRKKQFGAGGENRSPVPIALCWSGKTGYAGPRGLRFGMTARQEFLNALPVLASRWGNTLHEIFFPL